MSEAKVEISYEKLVEMWEKKYSEDPERFDHMPGRTHNWTPSKLIKLFSLHFSGEEVTHDDIAESLGFERSTVTKKINSMDWQNFAEVLYRLCSMTEETYIQQSAKDFRIQSLAKAALRDRHKEINLKAQLLNIEENLIARATPIPQLKLPPIDVCTKRQNSRTPEHMVLLYSDSHVGLGFDDLDTGGLGQFNHEILIERMANLRQGLVEIYKLHAELYKIPKLYVLALGDCIQGGNDIGNWGCAYNTLSLDEQVIQAADLTSELLSTWSNVFEEVNFIGVSGNHGRMEKKNISKVRANFDNIVYALVKARMSTHPNVKVSYKPAWWAMENINNTRFCLVHGDNMRNSISGLVQEEQRIQGLVAGKEDAFSVLVAGHFHTHHEVETSRGRVILNGSFVGGDVHSMKNLRVRSKATQTVLGVHPERGITWKYCIDLDSRRD